MSVTKDDVLEALGFNQRGVADWMGPALIGFGAGALIGATVALLLAPRTGSELRDEIATRGRRIVRRGREQVEEMTDRGPSEPQTH